MFSSLISNRTHLAQIGLVFTTLAWGATFVLVKEGLNHAQPFSFGAYRFLIATICAALLVRSKIIDLTKQEIYGALLCGFFLFTGYAFQNFGLWENEFYISTTPSKSAFITSISIIMVPLMLVLAGLQKVTTKIWVAIILATIGLYLLLDPSGSGISLGDGLTFGCATCFAIHIIIQDRYAKGGIHVTRFFFIQVAVVTLLSFICSYFFDTQPPTWSAELINALLMTGIIATTIAILIMIWAQQILSPSQTALIFSLEPVFAAVFSWILIGEILGFWGWVGGVLVVIAVVWSESKSEN
ncbi:MAG: DMT family transporter [Candidatus Marinimicrobia bacterium]|nr:DMT family transporter [Candidatus Neomarinimicrobiota bacterium]